MKYRMQVRKAREYNKHGVGFTGNFVKEYRPQVSRWGFLWSDLKEINGGWVLTREEAELFVEQDQLDNQILSVEPVAVQKDLFK